MPDPKPAPARAADAEQLLRGAEQDGDEELWRAVEHEVGVLGGSWTGLDPPFAGGEGERLVAGS